MAAPAGLHRYGFSDYLAIEEASNTKHEFQLRGGPCRVYSSDLRVRALATGLVDKIYLGF